MTQTIHRVRRVKMKLKHLLVPKQNRVYCRAADKPIGNLDVTIYPSKTTCANCLSAFRTITQGDHRPFATKYLPRKPHWI